MSATHLSDLPQLIADQVKEALPGLKEAKGIEGRFSLAELKSSSVRAPGILVSLLGAKQSATLAAHVSHFKLRLAAYVVTKDARGLTRDRAAAVICEQLLVLVPGSTWEQGWLGEASAAEMVSLVTSTTKDVGTSLWAVTWEQDCQLVSTPIEAGDVELYVGQSPDVGAAHTDDYERIGGGA